MSDTMYREEILDHYHNPHNFGSLNGRTHHAREVNPLCGDELEIDLVVKGGKVIDIRFSGRGCAISQASASMLTDTLKDKTLDELEGVKEEDVFDLLGVTISPARTKCALLVLAALNKALGKKA